MAQGHARKMVPPEVDGETTTSASEVARKGVGREVAGPSFAAPALTAPVLDQGTGNVAKIRDILFGSQMREYEHRFASLEESLVKELTELRESTRKRSDAIEAYIKEEFESLQARLKNEREERGDGLRQVARDLSELGNTLTKRIGELDEQTLQAQRQLRLELLQTSKALTEDLGHKQDETTALIEKRFQELRKGKTDRAALSALFTELGMRLNDEFQVVGGGV